MWLVVGGVTTALAALIGAFLTYKATTRLASGSVSTTQAETLWEEVNRVKTDYQAQATEARQRADGLQAQLAEVQATCASLRERVLEVERKAMEAQRATEECRHREDRLLAHVKELEATP